MEPSGPGADQRTYAGVKVRYDSSKRNDQELDALSAIGPLDTRPSALSIMIMGLNSHFAGPLDHLWAEAREP